MSRKSPLLATNILWLYGLQGLNYLIPAILLPFLVRTLGLEGYGLIAFAQSIAQYFVLATDYGFNFSATRAISRAREDRAEVSRIFWTVMTAKFLLLVLGAILLEALLRTVPRFAVNGAVYRAAYLMVVGSAIFPLWLFQGIEQMRAISIFTGVGKLIAAIAVVTFVKGPQDIFLATLLLSLGFVFAGVLGVVVAIWRHVDNFSVPSRKDLSVTFAEGRHLFVTTAAVSLYSNTNTFLVGMLAGVEQAGYFALADKLIRAITGLMAPVIQAVYPRTVALIAHDRQQAMLFIRRVVIVALLSGTVSGTLLLVFAQPLAVLAFAQRSDHAVVTLMRILSLFPLLSALTYVFGVLVLIPLGFDKEQSRMLLALGVVNVLLGGLLITRYGAVGGVIAMNVTETLQVIGSGLLLRSKGVRLFRLDPHNEALP
jgi:PST family polysaccharide transporter